MNRSWIAVVTLVLLATSPAWATDYTWTGAGEGTNPRHWSEPTNWSPAGVPGANDSATIAGPPPSETYSVQVGDVTVRQLTVLPLATLVEGTITVQGTSDGPGVFDWKGGELDCTVNIPADSTLNLLGGEKTLQGGTINNAGTTVWTEGLISGSSDATFNNSGTFSAAFDGTFTYSAGLNSGTFKNTGTFVKEGSAGTSTFEDTFDNSGAVVLKSGTLLFDHAQYAPFTQSSGTLSLEGGTLVAREGGAADGTREALTLEGGTVQGAGTLDANVNNTGAVFSPGADGIGTLTVTGDYAQSAGAQLLVDVGPSGHDVLAVGGASGLNGTLKVRVQSGFTPTQADNFQVLTAHSVDGTFSSVSGSGLETRYGSSDVTLGGTGSSGGGEDKGGGCSSTGGLAWPLALLVLGSLSLSRRRLA